MEKEDKFLNFRVNKNKAKRVAITTGTGLVGVAVGVAGARIYYKKQVETAFGGAVVSTGNAVVALTREIIRKTNGEEELNKFDQEAKRTVLGRLFNFTANAVYNIESEEEHEEVELVED